MIFIAFLLFSTATPSPPKQDSASSPSGFILQCAGIASALIQDPNGFLKISGKETIMQGCTQSISDILGVILTHEKTPAILGAGLLVVSGYFLFKSYQLYKRIADLEQNLEKYSEDYKLLLVELDIINDFINKEIEPQWKNGNTAKILTNIDTVIEKLINFVNRLNELADLISQDIVQGHGDKMKSVQLPVGGGIACVSSLFTGMPLLVLPTCAASACTVYWGFRNYYSVDETLKQSKVLKEDIMKVREEITMTRATLEVMKMKMA